LRVLDALHLPEQLRVGSCSDLDLHQTCTHLEDGAPPQRLEQTSHGAGEQVALPQCRLGLVELLQYRGGECLGLVDCGPHMYVLDVHRIRLVGYELRAPQVPGRATGLEQAREAGGAHTRNGPELIEAMSSCRQQRLSRHQHLATTQWRAASCALFQVLSRRPQSAAFGRT